MQRFVYAHVERAVGVSRLFNRRGFGLQLDVEIAENLAVISLQRNVGLDAGRQRDVNVSVQRA